MNYTLITLTHADDGTGRFVAHGGRTILNPRRIESIEEVQHPDKGSVVYITMMSGQEHTVMETVDQVFDLLARAFNAAEED